MSEPKKDTESTGLPVDVTVSLEEAQNLSTRLTTLIEALEVYLSWSKSPKGTIILTRMKAKQQQNWLMHLEGLEYAVNRAKGSSGTGR